MWLGEIFDESFPTSPTQDVHVGQTNFDPNSLSRSLRTKRTMNVQSPAERAPESPPLVYTRGLLRVIKRKETLRSIASSIA